MSAYMVFNYTVNDADGYKAYQAAAMPTIAASGAEVLVADQRSEAAEGAPGHATVVLRFESKDAAGAWYDSLDYQAARELRLANTSGFAVLCEGLPPR